MNLDFSAVLVFLTFISGIIWLFGVLFFADKNCHDDSGNSYPYIILFYFDRSYRSSLADPGLRGPPPFLDQSTLCLRKLSRSELGRYLSP